MNKNEKKKVLFLMGMEHNLEDLTKQMPHICPENIMILQTYAPFISHPFGDLMRDIIVAVYQENVQEIVVVSSKDTQENTGNLINKVLENKNLQKKIETLDYLFKNCMADFPERNVSEWLKGTDVEQNSVNIIREHPLMPSHVKVRELFLEKMNEMKTEIEVC